MVISDGGHARTALEERMNAARSVERAWKAVMAWYQPQSFAERDHREKEFENIATQGDEDPNLLFARVEGKLNMLSALGIHKSNRDVVRILARRLPHEFYDGEQRTSFLHPSIK